MKKGFFLLEALLACVLLSLLVGSIIHHYAQWARSYKNALDRSKALAALVMRIEHHAESYPESDLYVITHKKITIPAPESSFALIPTIILPQAQCMEIKVSWPHDANESLIIYAVLEGAYGA